MSKIFKSFYGVILVLWIAGGSMLMYYLASTSLVPSSYADNVLVRDGNFEIAVSRPVTYHTHQSDIKLSKEIDQALTVLTDYLIDHPEKHLIITGLYSFEESQRIADDNIGLHRAQNIKDRLIGIGANPSSIFLESKRGEYENQYSAIHGIQLNVVKNEGRVNVAPRKNSSADQYLKKTTFLLPRYTSKFDKLEDFNLVIDELIESSVEAMNQSIVITIHGDKDRFQKLANNLKEYLIESKDTPDLHIIYNQVESNNPSDRVKQILKVDIGLKRLQNYSELLGS